MSLLISSVSFSQLPTITAANQMPAVDDSIFYADANSFGFDPDGTGPVNDKIWDYTGLTSTGNVTFWYLDPATTPETANYPLATMAYGNSTTPGYEYFENTANTVSRWGYSSPTNPSLYYDNSWVRYTFPLTPGVVQNVPLYTGTMELFGTGEDSVTIANGSYSANPDAYGELSLPPLVFGGQPEVFDSVIRVHILENFQIVLWFSGAPALTINIADDFYVYFDEETQDPIVIYGTTTDDAGGGTQTVLRYQNTIAGTGVAGGGGVGLVENKDVKFSIFPNPATDEIAIEFANSTERIITLFSAEGKKIESLNSNATEAKFDVSNLPSGVYMIKVRTGSDLSVKRVVVK
ncbi:MAG TPA: T9SS type A sorting domain-containing protein [Crocinitomicaceae bacterium]|nr:T9SS type A sorting domain-containing protein [Crocinitomicaceae bacterium]